MAKGSRMNLVGQVFGKLTVLKREGNNSNRGATWLCQCECGNSRVVSTSELNAGRSTSCGCIVNRHGLSFDKNFRRWKQMIRRCTDPKDNSYQDYGGRGIYVCDEWLNDVDVFIKWCLDNNLNDTNKLQIDRIDNDGPYSPENCLAVTSKQNNQHKRNVLTFNVGGYEFNGSGIVAKFGTADNTTVYKRRKAGWDDEKIALKPSREFIKKINDGFGLSVAVDAYGANRDRLINKEELYKFLYDYPASINMTRIDGPHLLEYRGIEPDDWGVTGTVVLAESAIAIHTFPDREGFFSIDIYSCKAFDPYLVVQNLKEYFKFTKFECHIVPRGNGFKRVFKTRDEKDKNLEPYITYYPERLKEKDTSF